MAFFKSLILSLNNNIGKNYYPIRCPPNKISDNVEIKEILSGILYDEVSWSVIKKKSIAELYLQLVSHS